MRVGAEIPESKREKNKPTALRCMEFGIADIIADGGLPAWNKIRRGPVGLPGEVNGGQKLQLLGMLVRGRIPSLLLGSQFSAKER